MGSKFHLSCDVTLRDACYMPLRMPHAAGARILEVLNFPHLSIQVSHLRKTESLKSIPSWLSQQF
jgi:hypothetical protein